MKKYLCLTVVTVVFAFCVAPAKFVFAETGGVLLLGGTGRLGSEIVKGLTEAGETFVVLVRPTSNRERLDGLDLTYVVGDMLSDADMERVFREGSFRAVIDASAIARGGDANFYIDSQRIISRLAKQTGVKQIILHGAIGAGDSADLYFMENVPEEQRQSMASKTVAETILIDSGVPYTIIRNMTLLPLETRESGNASLTRDRGVMGPVTRDGLGRLTMECLDNEGCLNSIFHATDKDAELTGRYTEAWTLYERIFKPHVLEANRP